MFRFWPLRSLLLGHAQGLCPARLKPPAAEYKLPRPFPFGSLGLSLDPERWRFGLGRLLGRCQKAPMGGPERQQKEKKP